MLYCEYNRIGGIELKIETTSSFIRMVGWKDAASSIKGFLAKHIKATYLELAQTKAFHIFKGGLKIWKSLAEGGDFITNMLTYFTLGLWAVVTIAIPVADFMKCLFLGEQSTYQLSVGLFGASITSLVFMGLIAIRIYIEWFRYYRSFHHLS